MGKASAAPAHGAKRLARLAAVQGLYQIALMPRAAKDVIADFHDRPEAFLQSAGGEPVGTGIDSEIFADVVQGVMRNEKALDEMIAGACDTKISTGRIETLLRAILRAGAYELHHHGAVPAGVIINDYVDVAHAFFGDKEPGLVNAVLDKLAKNLRSSP